MVTLDLSSFRMAPVKVSSPLKLRPLLPTRLTSNASSPSTRPSPFTSKLITPLVSPALISSTPLGTSPIAKSSASAADPPTPATLHAIL